MVPDDFAARLRAVQAQIARAAASVGRAPNEITLIAVTKTQPAATVLSAWEAGLRNFGENRVDELLDKRATAEVPGAYWHFIGHLQGRKARELVGLGALVHSVDRLSLAEELSKRAEATGTVVEGLLQVNPSSEASKGGWLVGEAAGRDGFFREAETILMLPALRIRGVMAMAPFHDEAERTRPTFAAVRALRGALAERFPDNPFPILSMGMTNDFEVAIQEGATHVRVGTALFGPRDA